MAEISEVKWARINAGLTQAQAAAAMGVSRETFNRWENGRMPELKLARFKKVLATGTVFAPPVPAALPAGPSKAALRAEYDLCRARWDDIGKTPDADFDAVLEAYCDARDAWYQAEHGAKWLLALYAAEGATARPENWISEFVHCAETPAYKAFQRTYGLDLQ